MKGKNITQFCDQLDTMFLIAEEMIDKHGEDSFCCAYQSDSAMISVFDGCGGLGSRTYPGFKGHTGAYMASRLVSGAIHTWYRDTHDHHWESPENMLTSLNEYLVKVYSIGASYAESNLKIRGSMVRDFPTTAAIALAQQDSEGILLHIIWAGDSRVYLMDAAGLAQLTKDDVDSEDALSNLSDDGALTNILSSDGKYTLHYRCLKIDRPTVVFAATDGCFGYIPSPMEFEYTLLNALEESRTAEEFKKYLKKSFHDVAGDDFALGLMSFFYGTFENLKNSFVDRTIHLEKKYIIPLQDNRSSAFTQQLWQEYRCEYERYL